MPIVSWLFVKDGESIWIERPHGYAMIVAGPGAQREEHDFDDEAAMEAFQVSLVERLTEKGWLLWGSDRDRRSGQDRRGAARGTPDRRRTTARRRE
jgi:hypothetical protein